MNVMRISESFIFAAALFAVCCGDSTPQTSQAPPARVPTVDVVRVTERPIGVKMELPGELQPYEEVAIFPRVTGYVKTIRVDRGSRVRAGEVLAVLEAPELVAQRGEAQSKLQSAQAQLAAARSRAAAAASTFERLKAAAATPGVVAGNDVMVAQKNVEADQSQLQATEQMVEAARQAVRSVTEMESYLRISAPFAGTITERNAHPGSLVGPGGATSGAAPMFRVVQSNRLRLVVPVPEAYIAGITPGTTVPFTVRAYPGEAFTGRVARVARAIDARTRTMAVEIDVDNRDDRLTPGGFSQVGWPVERGVPSRLVPAASVASTTDRVFVIRIKDGRTEWVDVKTGLASGTMMEVFGDLRGGDVVVARGTDELRPGVAVKIRHISDTAS
jgi:RND family efflux transporter MFP subunit